MDSGAAFAAVPAGSAGTNSTVNVVPRIPIVALGVATRTAAGFRLPSSPVTARIPPFSSESTMPSPWGFCSSKLNRSIFTCVAGRSTASLPSVNFTRAYALSEVASTSPSSTLDFTDRIFDWPFAFCAITAPETWVISPAGPANAGTGTCSPSARSAASAPSARMPVALRSVTEGFLGNTFFLLLVRSRRSLALVPGFRCRRDVNARHQQQPALGARVRALVHRYEHLIDRNDRVLHHRHNLRGHRARARDRNKVNRRRPVEAIEYPRGLVGRRERAADRTGALDQREGGARGRNEAVDQRRIERARQARRAPYPQLIVVRACNQAPDLHVEHTACPLRVVPRDRQHARRSARRHGSRNVVHVALDRAGTGQRAADPNGHCSARSVDRRPRREIHHRWRSGPGALRHRGRAPKVVRPRCKRVRPAREAVVRGVQAVLECRRGRDDI